MSLRLLWLLPLFVLLEAVPAFPAVEEGKRLFGEKGCAGCHVIDGVGNAVGPDLSREGTKADRDRDWHLRHLLNPAAVVPGSIMPMMVTEAEAEHLADYLLSLTGAAATEQPAKGNLYPADVVHTDTPPAAAAPARPTAAPPPPATTGSADRGRALFAAKGCPACHTVRGTGGSLGPDLTFEGEVASHDAGWHRRHLADPGAVVPGSTMPPFVLTATQEADLIAYLTGLVHLEEDRALSPELATRFAGLGERLEQYRQRVDHAHDRGRNVDDLTVQLAQAWTHVGAVEQMIRDGQVTGAKPELDAAGEIADKLDGELGDFEAQLAARERFSLVVVLMLLLGTVIATWKVHVLNRDRDAAEAAAEKGAGA